MKKNSITAILVAIIMVGVAAYAGIHYLSGSGSGSPLLVYSADAYVQESNYYLNSYHNATGSPVLNAKGGGSFTAAREIGQGDPSNVFISVALQSYNQSYLGSRYSGWAVAFASDQLVLAYSNATDTSTVNSIVSGLNSALSRNSTTEFYNAFSNLTSGKVKVGISDPASDPAGLRGWISLEIAGNLYANGNQSYFTSQLTKNGGLSNSSSAAQLVSPLVSGQIQFLFIYKSAAISKGLSYVSLPAKMNFGELSLASYYSSYSYNTTSGTGHGSAIMLYVTSLANNSAMAGESLNFTAYVFEHGSYMSSFGLLPLSKPVLYSDVAPPQVIQQMVNSGKIISGGRF